MSSPRWNIDFSAPGNCTVGTPCNATLRIEALGEFHVNAEFKFRFSPADGLGATVTGGGPSDFARQGPKLGTMSLGFTPTQTGTTTLAGTFKICVCTESMCEPEAVKVSLAIPVGAQGG